MPYTDIAKALSISSGTVHVRIKKLEEMGIIKSSNLHINQDTMGFDITAFLGIYLSKSSKYNVVAKELEKISEVIELNYTTGMYSMFIKVVCKDTKHLRDLLHDKIQQIEDITRTETFIVLDCRAAEAGTPISIISTTSATKRRGQSCWVRRTVGSRSPCRRSPSLRPKTRSAN